MRVNIKFPEYIKVAGSECLLFKLLIKICENSEALEGYYSVQQSHAHKDFYFVYSNDKGYHVPKSWCIEVDPFEEVYIRSFPNDHIGSSHYFTVRLGWTWHIKEENDRENNRED